MSRRIRDLAATVAVLLVIFGTLVSINPRMRERVGEISGDAARQDWSTPGDAVGRTAGSALAVASGYAADSPYLFAFLAVALVLFVLMVRS
jgi:hypothetical protein